MTTTTLDSSEYTEVFGSSTLAYQVSKFLQDFYKSTVRSMCIVGLSSGLFFGMSQVFGFIGINVLSFIFYDLTFYALLTLLLAGQYLLLPAMIVYVISSYFTGKKNILRSLFPSIRF